MNQEFHQTLSKQLGYLRRNADNAYLLYILDKILKNEQIDIKYLAESNDDLGEIYDDLRHYGIIGRLVPTDKQYKIRIQKYIINPLIQRDVIGFLRQISESKWMEVDDLEQILSKIKRKKNEEDFKDFNLEKTDYNFEKPVYSATKRSDLSDSTIDFMKGNNDSFKYSKSLDKPKRDDLFNLNFRKASNANTDRNFDDTFEAEKMGIKKINQNEKNIPSKVQYQQPQFYAEKDSNDYYDSRYGEEESLDFNSDLSFEDNKQVGFDNEIDPKRMTMITSTDTNWDINQDDMSLINQLNNFKKNKSSYNHTKEGQDEYLRSKANQMVEKTFQIDYEQILQKAKNANRNKILNSIDTLNVNRKKYKK